MRTRGAVLGLWLTVVAGMAGDGALTLSWLRDHPEARPKQVALAEDTPFSVFLDGKPVGSATVAAGTLVDLAEVGDATIALTQAGGRADLDPAKTDLWARIGAARADKDQAAAAAPGATLRLPADSLSADWYADRIRDDFDPWLAKWPDSPLFADVKARREAFAAEMSRVAAGEQRHGERWIAAEELFEWKDDTAAETLRLKLADAGAKGDADALAAALSQVAPLAKAAAYPALVRSALAAVDAALPRLTPEGAKAALQEKKDKLSAKEDSLVADLRASVGEAVPSSTTQQPGWSVWQDGLYRPDPVGEGDGHHYVFAHHYTGLKEFYPDDEEHSYYHVLPDGEVARLQKEADTVRDLRKQKASFDAAMQTVADAAKRDRDQIVQLRAKLAAEPLDRMDQAVARLPEAAAKFDAGDIDGGRAVLADVDAAWPGSQAAARWRLDRAAAALNEGKKPVAAALLDGTPDWPRAVRLRAAAGGGGDRAAALAVLNVPAAPAAAPAATPAPQGVDAGELKRHDASRAAWKQAVEAISHGGVAEAWNAFREAREQWPENPAVNDAIFYAELAGGAAAFVLLLWLWKRMRGE